MADDQAKQIAELKKIAKIRVDKERHQLAAMNDEAARLEAEQKTVRTQIAAITSSKDASPQALINAYAYLDTLAQRAERIAAERSEADARKQAQQEKIKTALASKIRVDGMGED